MIEEYALEREFVPAGVDPSQASIARVYDAALGGKENFEADRAVLERARTVMPEIGELAWANRSFLIRAVRFLAVNARVTQYLDCGAGLPTAENTHQVVQRVDPSATVVYVDHDPVAIAHGNALLAGNRRTHMVAADIFEPERVLSHETVAEELDFTRPVALLHVSTLDHHPGDIATVLRGYLDALPSGSYVVVSHLLDPDTPELTPTARRLERVAATAGMGKITFRTREQIEPLVEGWEIMPPGPGREPGLVTCDDWWPDGPRLGPRSTAENFVGCVVARRR